MKTIIYALSALALATTAAQAANDGFQVQSENLAVTRGDDIQAERSPIHRYGPAATVRLQRDDERAIPSAAPTFAPKSDDWMRQSSSDRDTVYGD